MISIICQKTLNKPAYKENGNFLKLVLTGFVGLSTDTKPEAAISEDQPNTHVANGSLFYEMDTGEMFCFDQGEGVWL